ncbi:MAG: HEAT repeat domain-containing protein [Candidatus Methylomirabilia bacterium]
MLEDALLSLKKTTKGLSYYPPDHPVLRQTLEQTRRQVATVLDKSPSLTLTVAKDGFSHQGKGIGDTNRLLKQFALDLYFRGVRAIHFPDLPSTQELEGFLRLLLLDPERLREMGGLQQTLLKQGITNLMVEELEFKFMPGQGEASAEAAPSRVGEVGELSAAIAEDGGQKLKEWASSRGLALPTLPEKAEQDVDDLLKRWEAAEGLGQYQHIAEQLEVLAQSAREAGSHSTFLKILSTFVRHTQPRSRIPREWQDSTKEAIQRMASEEGLAFLIDHLCTEGAPHDELVSLLGHLGPSAASLLLERLKEEQRSAQRRILVEALIHQEQTAVPFLLDALEDRRWYVVRNAAFIVGKIGVEEAINPLARLLKHEDNRVRWEVVKALGQIGGPQASQPLLDALQDTDGMACQYAIAALGELKEAKAAAGLTRIASRHKDWDLRKAAILALGQVGGVDAVSLLVAILRRKRLFRRRAQEQLSIAAAVALGMLGTGEAVAALKGRAEGSSGTLRQACLQALEAHSKTRVA